MAVGTPALHSAAFDQSTVPPLVTPFHRSLVLAVVISVSPAPSLVSVKPPVPLGNSSEAKRSRPITAPPWVSVSTSLP